MILGFLWEYSTAFSASELLPQVSPQPEFLPVSRNISLTGSISFAAKSFRILVLFPLSLSSISTLLSHPCQLNSYCRLKLRLIYWEEKRCTIAQIRSSIDAFAISFPLSASAQPAKLSQSSLRSTLAEEETSNPTTTDWRKTGVGSFNVEKHYWLAFCHRMGCEGNTEGKFYHLPNIATKIMFPWNVPLTFSQSLFTFPRRFPTFPKALNLSFAEGGIGRLGCRVCEILIVFHHHHICYLGFFVSVL